MDSTLYVKTLGGFSLKHICTEDQNLEITEQDSNSWRQWAFLEYLCVYHQRCVSQEEIIDIIWGGVEVGNPVNTLKTLLHRARLTLERLGFSDGKDVLRYRRGVYSWNPELVIRVDIEEFDALRDQFDTGPAGEEGLAAARKALALYQGDFLPHASASPWALSPRTHYHLKYLHLCFDMASVLWERDRLEEAVEVCRFATALDPYDETCQSLMMRLLHASGSKQAVARYYSDISALLMKELSVAPSQELTALYHELSGPGEAQELDLRTIRAVLLGDDSANRGAFFCQYFVFRNICRLLARISVRNGQIVQLGVITLFSKTGGALAPSQRAAAMEELKEAIQMRLRSGDIFTQFSPTQFLVLLPTASHENGSMAVDRVLSAYGQTLAGKTTTPQFSLLPALSLETEEPLAGFRPIVS